MNLSPTSRRTFLRSAVAATAGITLAKPLSTTVLAASPKPLFKLAVAEWSFHRALFGKTIKHPDMAKVVKQDLGMDALEYSAQFFMDKAEDQEYLKELKQRASDQGVKGVLITVDEKGRIGDPEEKLRLQAVDNHRKWVDAAKTLGCETIRVNAYSDETLSPDEQAKLVVAGLRPLVEFGATRGINVIVENHGHLSSNGKWLASVVEGVELPTCGTLPDFGNFSSKPGEEYDRYQGVAEMMPYAKGVSAKSYDFDAQGNETTIDYRRMLKIVNDAGYHGYLGIEYEGPKLSEPEGVLATKKLIETVQRELA